MSLNRRLIVAVALAVCIAVWEVDPRWFTEHVPGLNTREQGDINQANLNGSQAVAWLAAPLSLLVLGTVVWWKAGGVLGARSRTGPDWLGLWLASSLLGAFFAPDPLVSFAFAGSFAGVAVATRLLAREEPNLVAQTMIGGTLIFIALSAASRLLGMTGVTLRNDRLTFLSLEANQFGRMAALTALAGLFLLFEHRAVPMRALGAAAAVAGLGAVAMTGSRTGFVAVGAAVFVLVIAKRSRWVGASLGVIACGAILFLALTNVGQASIDRLTRESSGSSDVSSLTGRTDIWPVVVDVIGDRPISGHGFGSTTRLLSPRSVDIGFTAEHTHNVVLHVLATTGLLGLAFFVAAVATALKQTTGRGRPWVLAIVAYIAVAGVSEAILRNPDISLVALVFALTLAENPAEESHETLAPQSPLSRAQTVAS